MKILLKNPDGTMHVIADSAMTRSGQPWFVPDFGRNWRSRRAVALRVSRLGKEIGAKYAGRYFDAATLLWVAEADGCEAIDYMDGRIVCGEWMPAAPDDAAYERLAALLTEASHFATLKTGDVIAEILDEEPRPISPQTSETVEFKGKEIIKFNIR